MMEVSLRAMGIVLRLDRDAWSIVKRLWRAANEQGSPRYFEQM